MRTRIRLYVAPEEAAQELGIPEPIIREWIRSGQVEAMVKPSAGGPRVSLAAVAGVVVRECIRAVPD